MARFKVREMRMVIDHVNSMAEANIPVHVLVDGKKGAPLNRDQISGLSLLHQIQIGNADFAKDCLPEGVELEEEEAPKKKSKKSKDKAKGKKKRSAD